MTQELSQRALILLYSTSLICGFALGILYEPFRIRRLASRTGKNSKKLLTRLVDGFIIGLEDILFFAFAAIVTVIMYFAVFQGRVRIMAIVLECTGFALYRVSLGRLVIGAADRIIAFLRRVRRFIYRRIINPPLRLISKLMSRTFGAVAEAHRAKVRTKRSKKLIRMLYKAAENGFTE